MWSIATRELRSLFLSPLAWAILGVVQFILGFNFFSTLSLFLQPHTQTELERMTDPPGLTYIVVESLYGLASIVVLLIAPLLTMRLISEERRNKTFTLLLAAPISMRSIVLGKFFGLMGFFAIMTAITTLMPLSLWLGSSLDFWQITSASLGMLLLLAAFTAIGLYISTLTTHPTVAAIYTFGFLLLLWLVNWLGEITKNQIWNYLSIHYHFQPLLSGLFSTENIAYFLLITALFLILSIQRLDNQRF